MKKIFLWGLLAFVLSSSAYGQIRIDSVFIQNDTIIPNPLDSVQTLNDTIPIPYLFNFRGVSTLDPSITDVYWRVGIDYDNNGNFSTLYLSGAIPPGSTPNAMIEAAGLLEVPFGSVYNLSIELTTDPNNFGQSGGYNGSYNSLTFPIINTTGGRVAMGNKKKDNTRLTEDDCILGASLNNGILDFTVYNWRDVLPSLNCTANDIEFTYALITYENNTTCKVNLPVGTGDQFVGYTIYDDLNNITTPFTKPYTKFSLLPEERAKIQIDLGSSVCSTSSIESIFIEATFAGCPIGMESAFFCVGCRNGIDYIEHSTSPFVSGTLEYLPSLTESSSSINLINDVTVVTGDSAELVVSNTGVIRAFPNPTTGIKIEKGAYFWAHKDAVCPLISPKVPNEYEEKIEERTKNWKNQITVFPNPFEQFFNLSIELQESNWFEVRVFDVLGNQQGQTLKQYAGSGKIQLEVPSEHLAAGLYYCRIKIGEQIFTKNIVKTN